VVALSTIVHAAVLLPPLHLPSRTSPGFETRETKAPPVEVEVDVEPSSPLEPLEPLPNRPQVSPTAPVAASHPPAAASPARGGPSASSSGPAPTPLVADSDTPQFSMTLTATSPGGLGGGGSAGTAAGDGATRPADDVPLSAGAVDTPARLARGEVPSYPLQAREDGVEADVPLELVVSREGAVESAQVLRRAGHGLDDAALAAARRFRFTPATKQGHAVRVRVAWTVEFRLHGS